MSLHCASRKARFEPSGACRKVFSGPISGQLFPSLCFSITNSVLFFWDSRTRPYRNTRHVFRRLDLNHSLHRILAQSHATNHRVLRIPVYTAADYSISSPTTWLGVCSAWNVIRLRSAGVGVCETAPDAAGLNACALSRPPRWNT